MTNRWSWDEELDEMELDDDFVEVVGAGRGRKHRRRAVPRIDRDDVGDERGSKRRRRRWQVPPHKRVSDFDH